MENCSWSVTLEEPSNHVTSLSMVAPHVLPTDQRAGQATLGEGSGRPSRTGRVGRACCGGSYLRLRTQGLATSSLSIPGAPAWDSSTF